MKVKNILCTYATRDIDSNLMMSSIIFKGLSLCGYNVDMLFAGFSDHCTYFSNKYSHYFHSVKCVKIKGEKFKLFCFKNKITKLLYNLIFQMVLDRYFRPYNKNFVKDLPARNYDYILSIIPIPLSCFLAIDYKNGHTSLNNVPILQYWTDPLSLGGCNDVDDIPRSRFFHLKCEDYLLSIADKAVFCNVLLCEMEKKIHPKYINKITWSDVGYIDHKIISMPTNPKITIGLFGAYPTKIRNIKPLLCAIKDTPQYQYIIRGDSDLYINSNDYKNLDVEEGRKSPEEIELLENKSDILLILGNLGGIQIPGKIYYYANYPKPIVCICDSKYATFLKNYLRELGRYIVCDNNSDSIKCAINEAVHQLNSFELHIPERLNPKNIAKKLIEG